MRSPGLQMSLLLLLSSFWPSTVTQEPLQTREEAADGVSSQPINMEKVFGFLSCLAAVVLYGSNFVPVKKVETGDGMFFQWVYCAAIWAVGLVGDVLLRSSKPHPAAMLGGFLWATGNIACVPVVRCIGLGLGVLLWGASGLLIGWASSRFGLFGLEPEDVSRPLLNDCGAGLCLLSTFIFCFVKSDVSGPTSPDAIPILIDERSFSDIPHSCDSWVDTISPKTRRPLACILAVLAGLMFGSSFIPMLYIKRHAASNSSMFTGSSQNDVDYSLAQSSGIFFASTVYFAVYCVAMKNRPRIYPRAVLPGFLGGVMWGVATYFWLLANHFVGTVVTFPTVTAGCGLVAALWGSLVFKEVKGLGNILLFVLASCVVLTGSLLTAFSQS